MTKKIFYITSLIIFLGVVSASTASAMKITPPRTVIKSDEKVAYIYIKNDAPRARSFTFRWKHVAMTPDGQIRNLDNKDLEPVAAYRPLDRYIRYSPRRTTLQPGETQRITFLVRRNPDMQDGEYRSHFVVEVDNRTTQTIENTDPTGKETSVGVQLQVSRAFPVYLHHGNSEAQLTGIAARMVPNTNRKNPKDAPYIVEFDVSKTGNRSIIGNADVMCENTSITNVKRIFAVYAEANQRREKINVFPEKAPSGCSNMRVVIKGHMDDLSAGQVLAEIPVSR